MGVAGGGVVDSLSNALNVVARAATGTDHVGDSEVSRREASVDAAQQMLQGDTTHGTGVVTCRPFEWLCTVVIHSFCM